MPFESTLICPDTLVTSAALQTAASADIGATRSSIAMSAESVGRFAESRDRPSSRSRVNCVRRMGKGFHGRKGKLPLPKAETTPKPDFPKVNRATPAQFHEESRPRPTRQPSCLVHPSQAAALTNAPASPDSSATIAACPREPAGVDAEPRDQSSCAGSSLGARRWMSASATRYADAQITKIGT